MKLGIPLSYKPFEERCVHSNLQGISDRQMDVLNVAEAVRQMSRLPLSYFYADISQGVEYKPWGKLGVVTTGSLIWSFGLGRLLTGTDLMATQGHAVPEKFNLLQDR